MKQCKPGEILVLRNGGIARYSRHNPGHSYPHAIMVIETGMSYPICDDGRFWDHAEDEPHHYDVVGKLELFLQSNAPTNPMIQQIEMLRQDLERTCRIQRRILCGSEFQHDKPTQRELEHGY